MKPLQIEAWALRVIDAVRAGQPNEDSRVELKAEWPADPAKAARQIGAVANAALGDPVLWILGVDQKTGVLSGLPENDLSSWWPQVESHFDGVAPSVRDVAFRLEDKTCVALLFETDRAPYVVKTPAGSSVTHEVPWRSGTRTRSAMRADLLRMLAPVERMPLVEVGWVKLQAKWSRFPGQSNRVLDVECSLRLYIEPRGDSKLVIPFHRSGVNAILPGVDVQGVGGVPLMTLSFKAGISDFIAGDVFRNDGQFVIDGPKVTTLSAHIHNLSGPTGELKKEQAATVELLLAFVGVDRSYSTSVTLPPQDNLNNNYVHWAGSGGSNRL